MTLFLGIPLAAIILLGVAQGSWVAAALPGVFVVVFLLHQVVRLCRLTSSEWDGVVLQPEGIEVGLPGRRGTLKWNEIESLDLLMNRGSVYGLKLTLRTESPVKYWLPGFPVPRRRIVVVYRSEVDAGLRDLSKLIREYLDHPEFRDELTDPVAVNARLRAEVA